MPFVSRAQAKRFRELEASGELKPGTYQQWLSETPDFKKLPWRVKKASADHGDAYAAMVVAPFKDKWIASLRPADKRAFPGEFGLVGGKLNKGESAQQAALREAKEEGWSVSGIVAEPIHIRKTPEGKKVVVFAATKASKLKDFKEYDREVYPISVTKDELADSFSGNEFIRSMDEKHFTNQILTQDIEKEAVHPAFRTIGAAAAMLAHFHGLPASDAIGSVSGALLKRRALNIEAHDTRTLLNRAAGGVHGGWPPAHVIAAPNKSVAAVSTAAYAPSKMKLMNNNFTPKPMTVAAPKLNLVKAASINATSIIPAVSAIPKPISKQAQEAAVNAAATRARRNIAGGRTPIPKS